MSSKLDFEDLKDVKVLRNLKAMNKYIKFINDCVESSTNHEFIDSVQKAFFNYFLVDHFSVLMTD